MFSSTIGKIKSLVSSQYDTIVLFATKIYTFSCFKLITISVKIYLRP